MKLIRTKDRGSKKIIAALESRSGASLSTVLPLVRRIVASVRKQGDPALLRYAKKFDGLTTPASLRISNKEMATAWEQTPRTMRQTLTLCAKQIRAFAEHQKPANWNFSPTPGLTVGQKIVPLDSVGCYVPSGRHPLPSTLLMTAIPAQVAGVRRIVAVSPKPAPEALAAAHLLGITEFYRLGGAHAIAALAYGTKKIPRVDKIAGPGSLYVTAAKFLVSNDCPIDMLAGPTEIIVTSERGNPTLIAADLVAQAEHDPEALAIFITTRASLARSVIAAAKKLSRNNPVATQSLAANGLAIICSSIEEARALTNRLAPEHLTVDSPSDLKWVTNAGSVFIGNHSAQPLGDYISGPNHTLPTVGAARHRGGLSVNDFLKLITVQQYSAEAVATLGPSAILLAEAEGLTAHAESIHLRLPSTEKKSSTMKIARNTRSAK
jgi:histidinol dehydrogenase